MGLRDKFILSVGLSREYEKKLSNIFNEKVIDQIYHVGKDPNSISEILGKPFLKIAADSWENGRKSGSFDRAEYKKKGIQIVKGKNQYLLKDQIVSIYIVYLAGLTRSMRVEIEAEITRMMSIGFSFDTAMNSEVIGRLKNAFLNKCRDAMIQMNTQLFDFGKKDGLWLD